MALFSPPSSLLTLQFHFPFSPFPFIYQPPLMLHTSSSMAATEKKHWWLTHKRIAYRSIRDARNLIATQKQSDIESALNLLDSVLTQSARSEIALELKAKSLLYLRRFKDVVDLLQDFIPSLKMASDDDLVSSLSSDNSGVKLLGNGRDSVSDSVSRVVPSFKCFSVSELKRKVMAGIRKNCDTQGHWRYVILGQACCHLGLMEDAMVLLQTGKRLASAAFRRESICLSDDSFSFTNFPISDDKSESITHLITHIKLLLRRRTAAVAALDAGLYSEAIRHFTKIVDGRRGAPQSFLAECYFHRANAYRSSGRIAESIADCNRTLALNPTSIDALETRASILESIRCLPECLHDLEHLKLLYNSISRDRKIAGPAWKRQNVKYREIPGKLCSLSAKIQQLKKRVCSGETGNVDYFGLIGVRRGCCRSELQRAHLLLCLRHKPDKATIFMDRCEFADDGDLDSIRDRAKMSALLLYRLIQKGYKNIMATIMDEELAEKQRKTAAAALQAAINAQENKVVTPAPAVFQGVFCRDLAVVGNLLSQVGFNGAMPVKYEALSC